MTLQDMIKDTDWQTADVDWMGSLEAWGERYSVKIEGPSPWTCTLTKSDEEGVEQLVAIVDNFDLKTAMVRLVHVAM